ncbi:LacI family DNA-binding transcriptional regulator [Actinoplanes subtropicus]|uniref:LacI family DNA-binding transcriptional regulator n=1 Tax=Actinoplanes subtropicus TaxID=543632 RepID=UPI0005593297|nr:LacI family DNA-binding transcriptional regulator [Actinoplanes subtropicus]
MTGGPDRPSRPPTMADIAAHLGVSRQLVSLVFRDAPGASEETRRRVREAAAELGFRPHVAARSLRRTHSTDLGVIFAPAHSTELEMVEHIYSAASAEGYDVILSAQTAGRSTDEAADELLGHRCAGLVVIGSHLGHAGMRALSRRAVVPVVDVGSRMRNADYDVVRSSGDRGIDDMVTYLAETGHRQIAYVDPAAMPASAVRRKGYDRATERLGLAADVLSVPGRYRRGDYFEEAGAAAARQLLERAELPTAVVTPNDHTAVGVLQILLRAGVRIPEDVSLTGFDDSPIARLSSVDLTTVRQDPALMGTAAVEAAVRRIRDGAAAPAETVVETWLVKRGSVAPPR